MLGAENHHRDPGNPAHLRHGDHAGRGQGRFLQEARRRSDGARLRDRLLRHARGRRRRDRARARTFPAGRQPGREHRSSAGGHLGHGAPGLAARVDRPRRLLLEHQGTGRGRGRGGRRTVDRAQEHAHRRLQDEDRRRAAGCARLSDGGGDDRRSAEVRRAPYRRRSDDRGSERQDDQDHHHAEAVAPERPLPAAGHAQGQAGEGPGRVRAHGSRTDRRGALHAQSRKRRPRGAGRGADRALPRVREEVPRGVPADRVLAPRDGRPRAGAARSGGQGSEGGRQHQERQEPGAVRQLHRYVRLARRVQAGRQGLKAGAAGRRSAAFTGVAMQERSSRARRVTVVASLALGALVWEVAGRLTSEAFWAPRSATLKSLAELAERGTLLHQAADSFSLYVAGLALSVLVGAPLGLLLARVAWLRVALEDYIMVLYATPMVALIPFILSIMGFGFAPKVLVVFLFAVFPVLYNTIEGARSIRPELVEVAYSFRTSEWQLWRDVMIPYTLPYAMTGIRQAIARGLVGMVAAEFFLSPSGLGQMIMMGSMNFDTSGMLAAIFVIVVIGVALMDLGRYLERHFAAWRGYNP